MKNDEENKPFSTFTQDQKHNNITTFQYLEFEIRICLQFTTNFLPLQTSIFPSTFKIKMWTSGRNISFPNPIYNIQKHNTNIWNGCCAVNGATGWCSRDFKQIYKKQFIWFRLKCVCKMEHIICVYKMAKMDFYFSLSLPPTPKLSHSILYIYFSIFLSSKRVGDDEWVDVCMWNHRT